MADWSAGYAASWKVTEVDEDTWADRATVPGVRSMSATRACGGESPLLEEGSAVVWTEDVFTPGYLRFWMTADGSERVAVATLLFERSGGVKAAGWSDVTVTGRSVLAPAADERLQHGEYVARGDDCAAWVGSRLRACIKAPVSVEGSFSLEDDYVFDLGITVLDACWTLLNAGGWCIQIDGEGVVHVRPLPSEPSLVLDGARRGLLVPGVSDDVDLSKVPNRLRVVDEDGGEATATNEDAASELSYQRRGRWVDADVDDSPTRRAGETLQAYADRRLAELSTVRARYRFEREEWPDVLPYDVVRCSLPRDGLEGDMRVVSQSVECGKGMKIVETLEKELRP